MHILFHKFVLTPKTEVFVDIHRELNYPPSPTVEVLLEWLVEDFFLVLHFRVLSWLLPFRPRLSPIWFLKHNFEAVHLINYKLKVYRTILIEQRYVYLTYFPLISLFHSLEFLLRNQWYLWFLLCSFPTMLNFYPY